MQLQLYGLPLIEAARQLAIGCTTFKRHCREYGIQRWPYSKINSVNRLLVCIAYHGSSLPEYDSMAQEIMEFR